MKILFISHEATRSGAIYSLISTINELKKSIKVLEADVLLLKDGPIRNEFYHLCDNVYINNIKITFANRIRRKLRLSYNYQETYYEIIKKGDYDLVYANSIASLDIAHKIKKEFDVKVYIQIHEALFYLSVMRTDSEKLKILDKYIVVSEKCKNDLIAHYNLDLSKIIVQRSVSPIIRNYLDNYPLKINPVTYTTWKPDCFIIGFVGYSDWVKSIDAFPILVNSIKEKYPTVECKYVWIGEMDSRIRMQLDYDMRKLGMSDKYINVGDVDNPLDYISTFDIYVLLSREESFCLSAQESAFLRKPIVCFSDCSGIEEIFDNVIIKVPYLDFGAMADEIYKLYIDKERREYIGNKMNKMVMKQCTDDMHISKIVKCLINE